jgi:murein L,D-transpeptidase YafK
MSAAEFRMVVEKRSRTLAVYHNERLTRTYPVVLGRNSDADKAVEGDEATPVGEFYVCAKNPRSKFFLSLCISYPNAEDAERGLGAGLITRKQHAEILAAIACRAVPPQHTRLGGEIYIHGENPKGPAGTRGCIALENPFMQELYDRAVIGTPVLITP